MRSALIGDVGDIADQTFCVLMFSLRLDNCPTQIVTQLLPHHVVCNSLLSGHHMTEVVLLRQEEITQLSVNNETALSALPIRSIDLPSSRSIKDLSGYGIMVSIVPF